MIDWGRVNELREEVGLSDFDEVVELFLEEVDEVVERLQTSPDPTAYEEDMHFIKGCALNLGFKALSDLCHNGEKSAASGDTGAIDLPTVFTTYANSKAAFLAEQPPITTAA